MSYVLEPVLATFGKPKSCQFWQLLAIPKLPKLAPSGVVANFGKIWMLVTWQMTSIQILPKLATFESANSSIATSFSNTLNGYLMSAPSLVLPKLVTLA